MLPIHLLAWETDATLRAAIQASAQSSLAQLAAPALLGGGEIACDGKLVGPRSVHTLEARASFARGLTLGDGGPPEDSLSADGAMALSWSLTPLSSLTFTAQTSLGTTWGIRADSLLLARDPFSSARRLEYGFGADLGFTASTTPLTELTLEGGYTQEGALASDVPAALGADSREARAGVSYGIDVAPRLSLTPEFQASFTRYEHALLDIEGRRGRADIARGTLSLGASRPLTPELTLQGSAGATLASPAPITGARGPVIAPEAGIGLRYRGPRAEITARYSFSYTSLGPRVGEGQSHALTVRFTTWPFPASVARGALVRGLLRASHGVAPLGADPQVPEPGAPPLPLTGTLITSSLAGRAVVEIPIARGLSFTGGVDLTFTRGRLDPAPTNGEPRLAATTLFTVGLAATASTDKTRLYPRDPGASRDDAKRRAAAPSGPDPRADDRTKVDVGRGEEP